MREQQKTYMSDVELSKIAYNYLHTDILSASDFLERMTEKQQWFIQMIRRVKKLSTGK